MATGLLDTLQSQLGYANVQANQRAWARYYRAMYVIGTAGHVDHGKSTLIHALTGIDPDRLRVEKERGMTIELGFAWLDLPSGLEVSIVDVPGHERFIKNMLMGVGGIDLALLIVAADEGVMPQTREHLAILDLVRVERGIVVITKTDLVDEEWLELVTADIEEVLEGTVLSGSPTIAVSAETGTGLDELLRAIDSILVDVPLRPDLGRPRLPVDRSFTMTGFGAVVTGTLSGGTLRKGQQVVIAPRGQRARIRGLQSHRDAVEEALPGTRVAVNIGGVEHHEIERGDVLLTGDWLVPSDAFDCSIRTIPDSPRPVRHNHRVTLYAGTSESPAVVRLLDANRLPPGESGWAQIRTELPVPVVRGDYFVIRDTVTTIAGGQILIPNAPRRRRFQSSTIERLGILSTGADSDAVVSTMDLTGLSTVAGLAVALNLAESDVETILEDLVARGAAVKIGDATLPVYFTASAWSNVISRTSDELASYHREYPLRGGMPKEELRNRLGMQSRDFNAALARLSEDGVIQEADATARLPSHVPDLSDAQRRQADEYLALLGSNPYSPPTDAPVDPELLQALSDQGRIVRVNEDVVYLKSAYEEMSSRVVEFARDNGEVTISDVRELFSTSRKYTLALLEHMDRLQVTRRVGDNRVLR